ncbi:MAG: alpha-isopropylmalate synthase regulatory domain-containing protein [Planctomyces sp.]
MHLSIGFGGRHYQGKGVSTDIIEAAARAFLQALNREYLDLRSGSVTPERAQG